MKYIALLILLVSATASADNFNTYVEYKNQINFTDARRIFNQDRLHVGIETKRFYGEIGFLSSLYGTGYSSEIGVTFVNSNRWQISTNWEGYHFDSVLDHNFETVVRFKF